MTKHSPKEHILKIERTAHYYTLGNDITKANHIWIIIHGYGQLAARMIRKFDHVDLDSHYLIAPEAISKHYVKRSPNIVGAIWMTKEHRLDEIDDYLKYLTQLLDPIIKNKTPNQTINILGFSQGTSTMWRWINDYRPPLSCIINWAGEFPPEIDYLSMQPYLNKIDRKYFCIGDKDEFITAEREKQFAEFMRENKLELQAKRFEGTHVIDRKLVTELFG